MKRNCFKIIVSLFFLLSVFNGVSQNDQPVLERQSVSAVQHNREATVVTPELKKNSIDITNSNKSNDFSEQLNAPQLKRFDNSNIKKEQPKNSK